MQWDLPAALPATFGILVLIIVQLLPESPIRLVTKDRYSAAGTILGPHCRRTTHDSTIHRQQTEQPHHCCVTLLFDLISLFTFPLGFLIISPMNAAEIPRLCISACLELDVKFFTGGDYADRDCKNRVEILHHLHVHQRDFACHVLLVLSRW